MRYDNLGSYSVVMRPPFISPMPAILTPNGKGWSVIKDPQSPEDVFQNFRFRDEADLYHIQSP